MKLFCISVWLGALACTAQATLPTLSISANPPAALQITWPTNFPDWQLLYTTNVSSGNWQPVPTIPIASNNLFSVLFPSGDASDFFRLKQPDGGCVLHATPSVITSGGSSTLTWCPVSGTTYRLSPGPGIVTSNSLIVSPAQTTVYALTASNVLGVVTNFATVIVDPCGFGNVTNWIGTMNIHYQITQTTPDYKFDVARQALVTFRLTRLEGSAANAIFFGAPVPASANSFCIYISDAEDDLYLSPVYTTWTTGYGAPTPSSFILLNIDCASATYSLSTIIQVDATQSIFDHIVPEQRSSTIANVASLTVGPRPLPLFDSTISFSGSLPARGPAWFGGGEYYAPNDAIANNMFLDGVVTDNTAGFATVSWSLSPAP